MSNLLKRVLGVVYVEETEHEIRIRGVSVRMLLRDMMKIWETRKVDRYMFNRVDSSLISFNKFFAPDVLYVLQTLLTHKKRWSGEKAIRKAIEEMQTQTWLAQVDQPLEPFLDRSKLKLFKKTPLEHQDKFFEVYEQRTQQYSLRGYLLSAAAGSGKTLTCLMTAEMVHSDFVVMVVPKNSVYKVWSKTLSEEYTKPQDHWIAADGKSYNGERFLIAHYEAMDKLIAASSKIHGKITVVLDESHNMNEMTSQRSQLFVKMCKELGAQHILWSSGTPLKAMGYEVIPLLRSIDPMFDHDSEERFKKIYGRSAQRALDILRNRMGMISHRVEKKDVVDNKASRQTLRVTIPNGQSYTLDAVRNEMRAYIEERLTHYKKNFKEYEEVYDSGLKIYQESIKGDREAQKAYDLYRSYIKTIRRGYDPEVHKMEARYCNDFELTKIIPSLPRELKEEFRSARSVIKYVELKVMGEALGNVLGKKRAQVHVDMIPYMKLEDVVNESAKKTVIFTSFVRVVQGLEDYFKKLDYEPVVIYGDTNSNLTGLVTQFERQESANPAIATYQSLSTAVPLIVANTAIFVNSPFRDHEKVQAEARVDRLGQDTPVVFVDVFLDTGKEPNISTRSKDILEWSKEQVAAIMGNEYSSNMGKTLDTYYLGNEDLAMEHFVNYDNRLEAILAGFENPEAA